MYNFEAFKKFHTAALHAAKVAHCRHFGANNYPPYEPSTIDYEPEVREGALLDLFEAFSAMKLPENPPEPEFEMWYTVKFECPKTHTPFSFRFPIPLNFPSDKQAPLVCMRPGCGVVGFHYQGLYMQDGVPNSSSDLKYSVPPKKVREASARYKIGKTKEGDGDMIFQFQWWHDFARFNRDVQADYFRPENNDKD